MLYESSVNTISETLFIFQPDSYKAARIEELMDTLECPVCLDTADTPPIYQCPEGHLICKV